MEYDDYSENQVEHLKLIQNVIDRMGRNSFALKGWAVSLVAALFALSSFGANWDFSLLALLPTIVFWGLDAYYLGQERRFRQLYDSVRIGEGTEPYSMVTVSNLKSAKFLNVFVSKTLLAFYGFLSFLIAGGFWLFPKLG